MTFEQLKNYIITSLNSSNTNKFNYNSLNLEIKSKINLFDIFRNINNSKKFFFSNPKNNKTIIAFGKLQEFDNHKSLNSFLNQYDFRAYGGLKFSDKIDEDEIWTGFDKFRFVIPLIEIIKTDSSCKIILNYKNTESIINLLNLPYNDDSSLYKNKLIKMSSYPDKHEWDKNIKKCLALFDNDTLKKIVLARRTELIYKNELDSLDIFENLLTQSINSYDFYYSFEPQSAFMAISPERLYKRDGNLITSDSLAGTRARGVDNDDDKRLETQLLKSKKEINEHNFVTNSIIDSLSSISKEVMKLEVAKVKKFKNVQHIHLEIKAILNDNISDEEIINMLHPTPAVGGVPKEKAMEYINQFEHFDRGWYAAPVGYISKNTAEFCVAIRSGLVRENTLNIFTGAGIIQDSVAEYEWKEIDNKMMNFLNVIK